MTMRHAMGVILVLAAVALTVPAPATRGASETCRVRNRTQSTHGSSFTSMVKAANDGDWLTVRGTCGGGVSIGTRIAVTGTGPADPRPVLTGRGRHRVLFVAGVARVVLRHLVITNGHGTEAGGIYNAGTLTLRRSIVRGSRTCAECEGGGILNDGALTLQGSVVRGNTAAWGGGIWNEGRLTLVASVVRGNRARVAGGGIYNAGTLTLRDSIVQGNRARDAGGGIYSYNEDDDPIVTLDAASSVTDNTPDDCYGTEAC